MPAVGITDHGSMAGAIELYRCAGKAGVKPLLGCEIYLVDDRRARQHSTHRDWNHLTLLAETTEGYHNLIKLCTLGYLEGYYYKPRVDYELLEQYADGIIALSGCLSGRTCQALLAGDSARAREELDRLVQIFGRDDVYIELQDAGIDEHRTVNPGLLALAAETGLPVVGTGDVHYLRAEDAEPHEALLCIQTNDLLSNPNRFRFSTQDFYLKTPDEMSRTMAPWGGDALLAPTLEIAERCNVVLDLDRIHLPRFDEAGDDSFGMLRRLCEAGMLERYGAIEQPLRDRLEFELQTIREMGFADYFLIVWDFVRFAKANGVSVGPGRGSAAGSHRGLRAAHHRPRPAALRPALRALPEPRAQDDARHRHRLLGARPRARDGLRHGEVRARARGADHHVLEARREGLGARCGARHGPALRRRRPHREARAGGRQGRLRGVDEAQPGAAQGLRRGRARAAGRRHGAPARGPRARRLDPRRRRRDRRPPAGRVPAAAAEGHRLRARDAVPDGRRRGARAAQDGLPRPAQPRRHRRGRSASSASRPASTWATSRACRWTTSRPTTCWRAATRWASSSSSPAACATRCGRSSRPSSRI